MQRLCMGNAHQELQDQSDQEIKEGEVVEIIRDQMIFDLKGCCKNIGFHSKNNVKLFKAFVFLEYHYVSSLRIGLQEYEMQGDQVEDYCYITGERR